MAFMLQISLAVLALVAVANAKDLRCYSCSSYMSQCKTTVDNADGNVFKTRCNSKCFARIGEDGATYRGCFDGFREIGDLKYDYNGCKNQTWNNKALKWCLCDDKELCNGDSLAEMDRGSASEYNEYNSVGGYYQDEKDYDQQYKRQEDSYDRQNERMDKYAKMGPTGTQGEPYENVVETNYGYDVAHDIAPPPRQAMKPNRRPQQEYYEDSYDRYQQQPNEYVEEPETNPYIDPRFRERPTFYVEEKVPEAGYYQQHYPEANQYQEPSRGRYYEEDTRPAPTYYEEERKPTYYEEERRPSINDEGVYKQNYAEEPDHYGPEAREAGDYSEQEEPVYEDEVYDQPRAEAQRQERVDESYMPYQTEAPSYEYDDYQDPQTSAPFTTKVQRVSPQLASQIQCTETGYYQNPNDCKQFVACLLDPHSKTPIMHLMECPNGLVWDNSKKICMEYSTTCDSAYYDDYPSDSGSSAKLGNAPSNYVEEKEQDSYSLDTEGYQQAVGKPDILTYYPNDGSQESYNNNNNGFKNYNDEEDKYETNVYADEYH